MSDVKIQELPASLINKDYIKGERRYNYEQWMIELLNQSSFFLQLNHGKPYFWLEDQSNKQPDCYGDFYSLDFKLAGCPSFFMHLNLHSYNIEIKNGVTIFGFPCKK